MNYLSTKMFDEIKQQPKVLGALEDYNKATLNKIASEVKERGIDNCMLAARGSSDNACTYFKYLSEVFCGIPCSSAAPGVLTVYNGNLKLNNSLVIGVSQSGKAADVMEILSRAKLNGSVTVSITNDTESPMAKLADYHIYLNAQKELSVAATKTMTAQLFSLLLLATYISGNATLASAVNNIPKGVEKCIANADSIARTAESLILGTDCFVLARGFNYAAAMESALKIQETTYIKAKAYAVSDFHHGPFAMVDSSTVAFLLMPQGESYKDMLEMYNKCSAVNARTVVYTDTDIKGALGTISIPSGSDVETAFYSVVTTQLLVNTLSTLRGINPDAPRGLNKVTITK